MSPTRVDPRYGPTPPDAAPMIYSATFGAAYERCPRLWVFESVWRLPVVERHYMTFGTILHGVLERYLLGDDQGRGADGRAVDLYPQGWTTCEDGTVTPGEAAQIQRLVALAVDRGVVSKTPGRAVEEQFWLPLAKLAGGETIYASGFMDLLDDEGVQDHKTTKEKTSKPWGYALSEAALAKNLQLLLYAKAWLERRRRRGEPAVDSIKLRHNVYVKTLDASPRVRKTEVSVSRAVVEQHFAETQQRAVRMHSLRERCSRAAGTDAEGREVREPTRPWHEVRGPDDMAEACNAYGGCQFLSICSGQERVEDYTDRVKRYNSTNGSTNNSANGSPGQTKDEPGKLAGKNGGSTVGFAEALMAKAKKSAALAAAPPANGQGINAPEGAAPAAAPAQAPAQKTPKADAPPWARPDCPACTGTGFNSKGAPCRICDSLQRKEGKTTSADFAIVTVDGQVVWEAKPETGAEGSGKVPAPKAEAPPPPAPAAAPPPKDATPTLVNTPAQTAAPKAPPKAAAPPPPAPEPEAPKEDTEGGDPGALASAVQRGRGRPKKGFTLLVDAIVVKKTGNEKVHYLDECLHRFGAALAAKEGVESYYLLDTWRRRDILKLLGEDVADEFGTDLVACTSSDPDVRALLEAVRPFAAVVIQGIR